MIFCTWGVTIVLRKRAMSPLPTKHRTLVLLIGKNKMGEGSPEIIRPWFAYGRLQLSSTKPTKLDGTSTCRNNLTINVNNVVLVK